MVQPNGMLCEVRSRAYLILYPAHFRNTFLMPAGQNVAISSSNSFSAILFNTNNNRNVLFVFIEKWLEVFKIAMKPFTYVYKVTGVLRTLWLDEPQGIFLVEMISFMIPSQYRDIHAIFYLLNENCLFHADHVMFWFFIFSVTIIL